MRWRCGGGAVTCGSCELNEPLDCVQATLPDPNTVLLVRQTPVAPKFLNVTTTLRNFTYENGTKPARDDTTELFGSDPNVEVGRGVMFGYEPNEDTAATARNGRTYFADGSFVEYRTTPVPRSETFPEGIKYAFQYVTAGGTPMLRYDNAQEHERHEGPDGDGEPIPFAGHVLEHYDRFLADVYQQKGGHLR